MKKVWRVAGGAMCLFALFIFGGCQTAPVSNGNTTAVATPSPASSATPAATTGNASANNLPVTLPVLDAMFADEKFAADLKSELQLTDEQIDRLRKVAREETASLRETETGEHGGTTTAATARAAEQIKSVLGEERAGRFSQFVSARWGGSGGEGGTTTTAATTGGSKPNSVPTDTRIVVNAPAYRMDVFENGQLVKTYKIGIGYPEFPLPTGLRRADTLIFNPTWTPPDEPWVESPSSKVRVGEKVDAGSPLNPLGLVKIPIGSPSLIHGGKAAAKLGNFASHGCVGLTNSQVQDVARVMAKIGGAQLTDEDVATYAKNRKETKEIKLARPVPVELRYETIVVEDGKLYIYRDVYDRDSNTEANLRAVLEANGVSLDSLSEAERAQVLDALRQMARDARGNPADGAPDASASATPDANNKNANNKTANNKTANKKPDAEGGKVTRTVKGQKEIVIELAALRGKGYPAPVGLDAGGGGAGKAATEKKGKRS